ncbi:helix-turn-helix domain-containing protein [Streptomyces sp. NBC_01092]|uniref:helix-turn-helix domain-containing protein n=1 Tax=Streptomyces sp. NBC_01092 TaxID=2903748 RepID=UPI00386D891F|nr:helix-turn-helix domain-containing protein [Streptomyces sp. NBC_01092]
MNDPSPERFGRYVTEAARAAGYDIDSPRGGGRKALAEAARMSAASVSRMLAGKTVVQAESLRPLAAALDVPYEDLLKVAGLLGGPAPEPPEERPLTPAVAARRLGIRASEHVAAFEVLVAALQRAERE